MTRNYLSLLEQDKFPMQIQINEPVEIKAGVWYQIELGYINNGR